MKQIQGIAAVCGFAIGPVFQFQPVDLRIERQVAALTDLLLPRQQS